MNAYLLHGPNDGQFLQVWGAFPPKVLRFPVLPEARMMTDDEPVEIPKVAEYYLDSILPMPRPLRGKIATYRFRSITPAKEFT